MADKLASIMELIAEDFAATLQAADDAQLEARMAIVRQFVRYADARMQTIGLSSIRHRGDCYVGMLTDGREFMLPGAETPEAQAGSMQELPYAQIGVTGQSNQGMLGTVPATEVRHY